MPTEDPLPNNPLELFLSEKNPATARVYRTGILQFLQWSNFTEKDFLEMSGYHAYWIVSAYQSELQSSDLAPNTILKKIASVRAFKNWAAENWFCCDGLPSLDNLPTAQVVKDTKGTTSDKMIEILSQLTSPQDKVIWGLLFLLGLRRAEVSAINLGDVNLSKKAVLIKRKREQNKVLVDLPLPLQQWLGELLAIRSGNADDPLLQNRKNSRSDSKRLSTQGIYNLVRKWGEMVGVKGLRPMKIRHTAITTALIQGHSWQDVMLFAGHKSANSLLHYDDRPDDPNWQKQCTELLERLI